MRLSWFNGSHGGRRKGRRQRSLKAPTLLVRQLERRRVLDAALTSLATTAVVADVNPAPVTIGPTSASVPPTTAANNVAQSAAIGSGAILNIPPVLVVTTDQNANEGQPLNLSAQGGAPPLALYVDPDLGDSHTATVTWGDGSLPENATVFSGFGAGVIGGTHTYADDGTYTVTVSVSDGNGGSDTKSFNVMVANVPPVLVTATDQMVNEGQPLDLSGQGGAPPIGLFVDPGVLDTHTATIDWGDGSLVQNATVFEAGGSGALGGSHTYADDGIYTVKVTVTDDDGGSDTESFKVTVNNVAPFVDLSGPTMVNEGSSASWSLGPVVDPGTDTVSQYVVHWGDGSTDTFTAAQIAAMSNSISHTYADGPNNYTISLDLVDEDGTHSAVDTLGVTVKDVAPFVDLTGQTTVNEGSTGSWSLGPVVDPGTDTVSQYVVHWGDGSTDTFTSAQIAGMGNAVGHTYADGPNNYTITLDLVDEDGTHMAVDSLGVTVKDVAPFVDLTGPTMVDEGAANTWNLGPVVDPGSDTVTQYVIHWGDGNTDTFTAAQMAAMSNNVGHTYADGPNNYTVSVDLVNEDGTHLAVDSLAVTVKNVPPFVDLSGPTMVDEGAPNTWMLAAVVDPGTDTVSQYVIHWGDGNTDTFTSAQIAAMSNSVGHTYADGPTNYTITLDLVDEDGTFAAVDTLDVTVKNVAPFVDLTGPTMVNEGAANSWNVGPVVDPGTDTVTQYIVHWGDGNTDTFTSAQIAAMSNQVGHAYADGPNNYTITLDLVDEDGTHTAVDTLDVTVKNVAPFVDLTGPTIVNEGAANTWNLGPVVDPGTDTVTQYIVHWGDGNTDTFTTAQIAAMSNNVGHTYADGPNNYTITLDLMDEDGTFTAIDTLDVTVKNVAPFVDLTGPTMDDEGTPASWTLGPVVDPGTDAVSQYVIHWGDGATDTFTAAQIAAMSNTIGHTYAEGPNNYTISVDLTDEDGTYLAVDTLDVTVKNVAPTVALDAVPDISENGTATITGTFSDLGLQDPHTVTVTWGDANNAAASTFSVAAMQNAGGMATLHVGDTFTSSTDGAVLTITSVTAATGTVGFSVEHQYLDDGSAALGNGTLSDTSPIHVVVADDDGGSDAKDKTVNVFNLNPQLTLVGDQTVNEGQLLDLSAGIGSFSDVGTLDLHTAQIDWGDGHIDVGLISEANGSGLIAGSHTYADNGSYTVTVRLADDDMSGDFANGTVGTDFVQAVLHVQVDNVAPTLDPPTVSSNTVNEGAAVSFTANFSDPGFDNPLNTLDPSNGGEVAESFTYDINWGDGRDAVTGMSVADLNGNPGAASIGIFGGSHVYADNGTFTVTVTIHDDDGGVDFKTFAVAVNNVAPTLDPPVVSNSTIDEGGSVSFSATFSDPGFDNPLNPVIGGEVAESFTYDVNWGDGRDAVTGMSVADLNGSPGVPSTGTFGGSHVYADNGTYTVTVTIHDDDGGSDFKTFMVNVNNVAPTLTLNSPVVPSVSVDEGGSITFSAGFSDPGFDNPLNPVIGGEVAESFTYDINWGDGRDAVAGVSVADTNGMPGTPSTGNIAGSHTYADDGVYTVAITVHDDDGGLDTKTFQVTVNNVAPSLTGIANLNVNEGQAFTLTDLGVGLADLGFDNPSNPTTPALGDPLKETFAAYTVDWGDGRGAIPVSIDNVAGRVSGSPGVDTTAQLMHSSYTYADDGTYTVTIRVADDNMGAFSDPTKFVTGTAGVDFVDLTFQITVNNVAPTLAAPVTSLTGINEAQSVNFNVTFTDPGFDNALNPNPAVQPLIADPKTESFRYFIDWGDGRDQVGAVSAASLVDANGGVGVLSSGSFAGTHNYADDGTYTVTLRIADDNMAAFGSTDKFATGTAGVDFVEQTFTVTVHNVVPTIVTPLEGDQVTASGFTKIRLSFSDPGYDNALNPTTPPNGSQFQESFTYLVNWGDGTTDTIQVSNVSGNPQVVSLQTAVLTSARTSGSEGVLTTGSFEVQHQYFGPPDPLNPTADIVITVTLQDDNGGTVNQSVKISNPGIQTVNVAIDTTPQVPRLVLSAPQVLPTVLDQTSAAPQSLQSSQPRIVPSEVMASSDRYLELVVISPDGMEAERYRLSDDALSDVRGLFATLPDGRYKVFLVRTGNDSHRLVMDVFVRRGRVIDPADASEGTRDRPPSSEGTQQKNGQQNNGQQNGAQPNGAQQVPLNANPLLNPVPTNGGPSAVNGIGRPNEQLTNVVVQADEKMAGSEEAARSRASMRWVVPLAALGLVATQESWSQRVGAALEKADENAWRRLRRAGRLGRRIPLRRENVGAASDEAK